MPIQMVSTQRLYRQIAEQIADLIRRGEFKPGDRLPAERELAAQFGVSRPSVREAFIALEIDGLIEVRVGTGVYISAVPAPKAPISTMADPGPFEVVAARAFLEGETAALAAQNATALQHLRIRETLAMMSDEFQLKNTGLDADCLFHVRIAEASGNSALAHLVKNLWDFRYGPMFRKLDEHFDTPARHAAAIDEHRIIVNAIERRDAVAARAAMQAHLDNIRVALEHGLNHTEALPVAHE